MHFVLRIALIAQISIHQCHSEWVKISQASDENRSPPARLEQNETKEIDITQPSPEWIEYQKQRFQGSNISQRLVVSGESRLKTSAEVIVPARISGSSKANRNQIFQTKTKLSLDAAEEDVILTTKATKMLPNPRPTKNPSFEREPNVSSFMGFLNFLTSLQRSLLTKTSLGIVDKIKMLKAMRDQLMLDIEDRFGLMFPKSRQKRGLTDESSFHFPSEAALMSISFLTFSVFLIKLVLQVIHIIKSKHYTYTGMATNNAMTAKSRMNARQFDESYEEDLDTLRRASAAIKMNPFSSK